MRVKFFANYDKADGLLKRFKDNYTITDASVEFTTGDDYDTAVVFNKTYDTLKAGVKIITIIQEPSWSPVHIGNSFLTKSDVLVIHDVASFEKEGHKITAGEIVEAPSYMWFHDRVEKDFFENTHLMKKTKKLSMIVSNLYLSVGNYRKRIELLTKILDSDLECDIYGRGLNIDDSRYKGEIENKFTGLLPYEYSIAIENCCEPNYITEKFIDPTLCDTVPIYCGAPNIDKVYYPYGFATIDLDSPTVIDEIKAIVASGVGRGGREVQANKDEYFLWHNLYEFLRKQALSWYSQSV